MFQQVCRASGGDLAPVSTARFCPFTTLFLIGCWLVAGACAAQAQNMAYASRPLKAVRLPKGIPAPVIDGALSDPAWKVAALASTFIDTQTDQPVADQTQAMLLYDDKNIYVGFNCHDSRPDAIVARETVRNADIRNDDNVSFRIDPFFTHQGQDVSDFAVNAIGTLQARLAGGRASKLEWQGIWVGAARRVTDGWTAEMQIPWSILSYPEPKGPIQMGFNLERTQARTRITSAFSDEGPRGAELEGVWQGVVPPRVAFKPRLSILPYTLVGEEAPQFGSWLGSVTPGDAHTTARSGFDMRYQPTPDLTAVGTYRPDFSTVEGAVEGIGFSRTERFVPDRRPFFLDGGRYFNLGQGYQLGSLFDSARIPTFDFGSKLYGQVARTSTVGVLGTYSGRKQGNLVAKMRRDFSATSGVDVMALNHQFAGEENTVIAVAPEFRKDKWSIDGQALRSAGERAGGGAWTGAVNFEEKNLFTTMRWRDIDQDFRDRLGFIPVTGYRGWSSYTNWHADWRKGFWRNFNMDFFPNIDWHTGVTPTFTSRPNAPNSRPGWPFRRQYNWDLSFETRSDYRIGTSIYGGKYDQQTDMVVGLDLESGVTNRFRQFSLRLNTGKQADKPYSSIEPGFSLRILKKLDLILSSFLQDYQGFSNQHVLTFNYELSPTRSWGGRVVRQNADTNWYLSYRNAGHLGTETYLILGDPNSSRFVPQLLLKTVFSL